MKHKQRLDAIEAKATNENNLAGAMGDLVCMWLAGDALDVAKVDALLAKIRAANERKRSRYLEYAQALGERVKSWAATW